jgi:hypothetical protein
MGEAHKIDEERRPYLKVLGKVCAYLKFTIHNIRVFT